MAHIEWQIAGLHYKPEGYAPLLLLLLLLLYLQQLSFHSVAVVLTLVQTRQIIIIINIHKRNIKKHSTKNTKHTK
jgi:hypothetical protein